MVHSMTYLGPMWIPVSGWPESKIESKSEQTIPEFQVKGSKVLSVPDN